VLGSNNTSVNKLKLVLKRTLDYIRKEEMGLVEHAQNVLKLLLMNGINPRRAYICIATTTWTIAMFIMDFLKGFGIAVQNTIMEKVLSHDLIIAMLPFYLHDVKRLNRTNNYSTTLIVN
jgi:hypothetical protein